MTLMPAPKNEREKNIAKANGSETRAAVKARLAALETNPIDWQKQWDSINAYWHELDDRERKDRRNARQKALREQKRSES